MKKMTEDIVDDNGDVDYDDDDTGKHDEDEHEHDHRERRTTRSHVTTCRQVIELFLIEKQFWRQLLSLNWSERMNENKYGSRELPPQKSQVPKIWADG